MAHDSSVPRAFSAFGNQDVERFLIATDCVYTLCNATLIFAAPTQNWWQHWIVSPFFRPTLQLVGGIPTPPKNISQIGSSSQLLGKIKNVPNHQPEIGLGTINFFGLFLHIYLLGGAITILKNDGVRQWEGLSHIWNGKIKAMFETTNQIYLHIYFYRSVYSCWSTTDSNKTDYGGYWS